MPELPEVETTLRGVAPHLIGRRIERLVVRERRLRYPVAEGTEAALAGQAVLGVRRRGKYLLLDLERGGVLIHLGMSGSLRVLPAPTPPGPHDHLDLCLGGGQCLRLRDPRRFGLFLWTPEPLEKHPLIRRLGPEPLGPDFDGDYLCARSRGRRTAVKAFIMDSGEVVGVGNIYASESLYRAGIHPGRACGRVSLARYRRLAEAIREVLAQAIEQGGTSLRDFVREDGSPGYFAVALKVYGRTGEPCPTCGTPIQQRRIGQRSSFFCPRCQR
jgi:formamidopyrimidine-DNA glycosylase